MFRRPWGCTPGVIAALPKPECGDGGDNHHDYDYPKGFITTFHR
ncbi:hypothetical protein [Escherichia coli IS1]|nr:hypothetical protein [Escherichia coli IS1]